jgi:hypothetical protein
MRGRTVAPGEPIAQNTETTRVAWEPPTVSRIGTFGESLFGGSKSMSPDGGASQGGKTA